MPGDHNRSMATKKIARRFSGARLFLSASGARDAQGNGTVSAVFGTLVGVSVKTLQKTGAGEAAVIGACRGVARGPGGRSKGGVEGGEMISDGRYRLLSSFDGA